MICGLTLPEIPLRGVERRRHPLKDVGAMLEGVDDVEQFLVGHFDFIASPSGLVAIGHRALDHLAFRVDEFDHACRSLTCSLWKRSRAYGSADCLEKRARPAKLVATRRLLLEAFAAFCAVPAERLQSARRGND
jgi:hypothetical protein